MKTQIEFSTNLPPYQLLKSSAITRIFAKCARNLSAAVALTWLASVAPCQDASRMDPAPADTHESRHIFGIIPNYRTYPSLFNYQPLRSGEKFQLATEDSLDRGTFAMAAGFGGLGQLTNSNKSFGQGAAGFGRYFGSSYGDFFIGNYMSEAVYPSILHQDPRYFRRGTGSGASRFGYALSRVLWTQRDSGGTQFNYSEWLGNSTAVAISNAYYPDQRSAGSAVSKLVMQVGVDAAGNVLKEFWPDILRKFSKKPHDQLAAGAKR